MRALDALVANKVIGETEYDSKFANHYSTDIEMAMHAVDIVIERDANKLDEHPFELLRNYAHKDGWTAHFDDYEHEAHADLAPMAIVLVLLKYACVSQDEIDAAMKQEDGR